MSASSSISQLVFVDPDVQDYREILDGLGADSRVIVLDAARDGIDQVTDALREYTDLSAVHFVSHGDAGTVQMGGTLLTESVVESRAEDISAWSGSFSEGADIIFWGCDVAVSESGQNLIRQIAELTGADVAASNNATGSAALGGDVVLETATGPIDATAASILNEGGFQQLLALQSVNLNGSLLSFANGTLDSGTANSVGAVYKFANAATVGSVQIDAYVTIKGITDAQIVTIDADSPVEFVPPDRITAADPFAPQIKTTAANGHVDFTISFKSSDGTDLILKEFFANSFDIDGRVGGYQEFVEYGGLQSFQLSTNPQTDIKQSNGIDGRLRFTGSSSYDGLAFNEEGRVQGKFSEVSSLSLSLGATQATPEVRQFATVFDFKSFDVPPSQTSLPTVNPLTTNDTTPRLTGTIGADNLGSQTFTVEVNGVKYTNGDGKLTVTGPNWVLDIPTALADGTYDVTATRTNAGLQLTDQTAKELVIDTVPPTIQIDPQVGDRNLSATEDDAVIIKGTTRDVAPGEVVTVTIDDVNGPNTVPIVRTATVDDNGNWTTTGINLSSLRDGTLNIVATVKDSAGNSAQDTETVNHDKTLSIAIGSGDTTDKTPVIAGTTVGGETGQKVTVTVDPDNNAATPNSVTYTTTLQAGGAWSINTETDQPVSGTFPAGGLPEGQVKITAQTEDPAGNKASADKVIAVSNSDTTAPKIEIKEPIGGFADGLISEEEGANLTIEGLTKNVEEGQIVRVTITDRDGSAPPIIYTTTVGEDKTWSIVDVDLTPFGLGEGTHILDIEAVVQNKAGQEAKDTTFICYDSVGPTIEILTPIAGDDVITSSEDDAVTIKGTTTGAEPNQEVTVTIDDGVTTVIARAKVLSDGTWEVKGVDVSSLNDGALTVTASVTDKAGNAASDEAKVIHDLDAAPSIEIKEPIGGFADGLISEEEGQNLTIEGRTTNVEEGQTVRVTITDRDGTSSPAVYTAVVGEDGTWNIPDVDLTPFGLGEDTHILDIKAVVENKAGQEAQDTTFICYDSTGPTIEIQTPIAGDDIVTAAEDDAVTIKGKTTGAEPNQEVTVTIDDGVTTIIARTKVLSDGSWEVKGVNLSTLDIGELTVTASVTDKAGNPASAETKILHDLDVKSSITISEPIGGDGTLGDTEDNSATISGITENVPAGTVVTVTVDDDNPATPAVTGSATVDVNGNWSVTGLDVSGLDNALLTVIAKTTDADGAAIQDDAVVKHDGSKISINEPIGGDGILDNIEDDSATISGTSENVPLGTVVTVTVDDDNPATPAVIGSTLVGAGGNWTVTGLNVSGLDNGTLKVIAKTTGSDGRPVQDDATVRHDDGGGDDNSTRLFIKTPIGDGALSAAEDDRVKIEGDTDAEPGQVVTVTVTDEAGETVTASTTVKPDGTWSIDGLDLSSLGEGRLGVTAEVTDKAGNVGRDAVRVEHDTIPPTIAITTPDASDNPTPVIGGTSDAEPGQKVTVTIDPDNNPSTPNDVVYTTTVKDDGTWSIDTKADTPAKGSLPPGGLTGPANVTADVEDVAGNPATPATQTLTVDTTGPVIAIDPLTDEALSATDDDAVNISGTTSAEPGQLVTVTIDDNDPATPPAVGSATVQPDGTWKVEGLDLSALKDGTLTIKADVTDAAGNPGSDSVPVDHDTVAPVIEITSPSVINNPKPEISGTTDAEIGQVVTVTIDPDNDPATDNSVSYETKVQPDGTWSIDTETATPTSGTFPAAGLDGPAKVTASVTDVAGNPSVPDEEVIDFKVDGPVIQIDNVGDGELSAGEDREVTVSGQTDRVEEGQIVSVTITDGLRTVTATASVKADGTWSVTGLDLAELADGKLDVNATVTNKAGDPATDQETVYHDTLVPKILIDRPVGDGALSASEDDGVTLSGTTTAEPGQTVAITVTDGTTSVTASAVVQPDGTWRVDGVDLSGLKDGRLDVTATVEDKAGNEASDTTPVTHDTVAPTIAITSPPDSNNPKPLITGTSDAEPGQKVTVTIDPDNDPSTPNDVVYTTTVQPDGTWSVDTKTDTPVDGTLPPDGIKGPAKVTAEVDDIAGNPATPATQELTPDPTAPKIAIDRPIGDGALSASEDDAVTVSGTSDAAPGTVITVTVDDGDAATPPVPGSATVQPDGTWKVEGLNLAPLKDGTLTVTASVTEDGKTSKDTAPVQHDTVPPVLTITTEGPLGDASPVIEGTTDAEPGQTVTVTLPDPDNDPATPPVVFTTTVQPDGSWSVDTGKDTPVSGTFPADGVPNGPLTVQATVEDQAGNPAEAIEKIIPIDDSLPTLEIEEPIGDGALSVSEDRSVTVSGSSERLEEGRTVTVTVTDGTKTVTGQATVGAGGAWSVAGLDLHELDDGTLKVKAEATDAAGNPASDNATVDHDTVLPEILIDRPVGDGALSASEDDGVTLSGTTTAEPGQTVAITVTDGTTSVTASAVVQPDGTWRVDGVDLSGLKDGRLDVTATVEDKAGNEASDTTPVTHDTVAPTIAITSPPDSNNPKPLITGTSDAEPGQKVTVTIDPDNDPSTPNDVVYTTTVQPDGTWSVDTKTDTPVDGTLPPDGIKGPAKVTAEVDDIAGNPATPATQELTPDPTAPKIAIDRPIGDGALSASEDDAVTVSGTSDAAPGTVITVTVDDGDAATPPVPGSATVQPDGTWKVEGLNLAPLKDGTLTVTASVTEDGKTSKDTAPVQHDTVPPVLTITTEGPLGDASPVIEGTTDAEPGQTVTVTLPDPDNDPATPPVVFTTTVQPDGSWSVDTGKDTPVSGTFPADGVPNGPLTVQATVEDQAGNPAEAIEKIIPIDDSLPTLEIEEPIGDGALSVSEDRSVTVSGSSERLEEGRTVTVTVTDGTKTVTGQATVGAGGAWSVAGLDLHELDDGTLKVKAEATDAAGNPASDNATVDHDTVLPEILIDRPVGDGALSASEDDGVTLSGTTTAEPGQTVAITVTDGTTSVTASAVVQPDGTWRVDGVDLSGLKDGRLDVTATVEDKAGNEASDTTPVTHDTVAPTIAITSPPDSNNPKPLITGTSDAEPGQKVTVTIDPDNDPSTPNDVVYTTTVQPDGTWSVDTKTDTPVDGTLPPDGIKGPAKVTAEVDDIAGNPATPATQELTPDPTAPKIAIDRPIGDGALSASEDDAVTVSGTSDAAPGTVITVTVDDGDAATPPVPGSATVQPDGTWKVEGLNLAPLKDGTLTVTASVTEDGKTSKDTAPVQHDTVPPVLTITTEGPLGDASPVIEGTTDAEPGQTVTVTLPDPDNDPATPPVVFTTTVQPDGSWSVDTGKDTPVSGTFPADGVPNGPLTVQATVEDQAGNPAEAIEKIIPIDDSLPTLEIEEPIGDGALSVSEDRSVTVSGSSERLEEGRTVTVTVTDGTKTVTGQATVGAGGAWSVAGLDLHELDDGTLKVKAEATDAAGNPASDNATVDHDTVLPEILIDRPVGDGALSASEDDGVTLSGTTTAEPGQTVAITVTDGTTSVTASAVVQPDGTWRVDGVDLSGLKDGRLDVTATVEDKAGNEASDTTPVTHDTVAPTIAITSPPDSNNPKPLITGTSDAEPGQKVTVTIDPDNDPSTPNDVVYTTTVQPDGTWSVDTKTDTPVDGTLPPDGIKGPAKVTAEVDDIAGNPATPATQELTPDPTAPKIAIDRPIGDGALSASEDDAVTVSGTSDAAPGTVITVTVDDGDAATPPVPGSATVQPDGTWKVEGLNLAPLKDGTLTVTASVTEDGKTSKDTAPVQHDTVPPVLTITTEGPLGDASPVIEGTTDAEPGQTVTVTLPDPDNDPATPPVVFTTTVQPDGSWSVDTGKDTPVSGTFPADGVPNGPLTVQATVEDQAGNPAEAIEKIIPIDDSLPTLEIEEPIGDGALSVSEDRSVTVSGSSERLEEGRTVTVTVTDGTKTVTGQATVGAGGAWSVAGLDLHELDDGTLKVKAEATDAAGNPASDNATVDHDTVLPKITIDEPIGDGDLSASEDRAVTISGTTDGAEEGQKVAVLISDGTNSVSASATVQADNTWKVEGVDLSSLKEGTLDVTAAVEDKAGNRATDDATVLHSPDVGPAVFINEPIGDGNLSANEDDAVTISGGVVRVEPGRIVTVTIDDADPNTAPVTATATVGPDLTWTVTGLDLSTLGEGELKVTATVTEGGVPAEDVATVNHDTIPPGINFDFDTGSGDPTPLITGQTDAPPGSIVAVTVDPDRDPNTPNIVYEVLVRDNGRFEVDTENELPVSGDFPPGGLTNGADVTASVSDPAGNVADTRAVIGIDVPPRSLGLDLQTTSDTDTTGAPNATFDDVTADWTPTFDVILPALNNTVQALPGDIVKLFAKDASGQEREVASVTVTAADVAAGQLPITSAALDDGALTFTARLSSPAGVGKGTATLPVTIVTDGDGVNPSIESVPRSGDFNGDGAPDLLQSNVATYPMTSPEAFALKAGAPVASFGALAVGNVGPDGSGAIALDPAAQLSGIRLDSLASLGSQLGVDLVRQASEIPPDSVLSGVLGFNLAPKAGQAALQDLDPTRDGVQTRIVLELPDGVTADTFYRIGATENDPKTHIYDFMADGDPATLDDGAELFDLDGDGTVDRVVVTYTAGSNGTLNEFGFLAMAEQCNDGTVRDPGETIRGSRRSDTLTGTDNDDVLLGRGGRDTLIGGEGNDRLRGGRGADRFDGGEGRDVVRGGSGNDTLSGGACSDLLFGGLGNDLLLGGSGDELMRGGRGRDTLRGGGGNDTLVGNRGADLLYGEAGNDLLKGGLGRDQLYGGSGNDTLIGGTRRDWLYGGSGDDLIKGRMGRDIAFGELGNDTMRTGRRKDIVSGGYGDDFINGGRGNDLLSGDQGNDYVYGGKGIFRDKITGGEGNDTLEGRAGRDTYIYTSTALGQGDLAAGTHETIIELGGRNFISFTAQVNSVLKANGVTLADADKRFELNDFIDSDNSIAFDRATGSLKIDLDGNGVFEAAKDAQIDLVGVDKVLFGVQSDRFILLGDGKPAAAARAADQAEPKAASGHDDSGGRGDNSHLPEMFVDASPSMDDLLSNLGTPPAAASAPVVSAAPESAPVVDTSAAIQSLNQLVKLQEDQAGLQG